MVTYWYSFYHGKIFNGKMSSKSTTRPIQNGSITNILPPKNVRILWGTLLTGATLPGFCQDKFWKFFHATWMKSHQISEETILNDAMEAAREYADKML